MQDGSLLTLKSWLLVFHALDSSFPVSIIHFQAASSVWACTQAMTSADGGFGAAKEGVLLQCAIEISKYCYSI